MKKRACILTIGIILVMMLAACNGRTDVRLILVEELNGSTHVTNETGITDAYVGQNLVSGDDVEVESESDMTLLIDSDKHLFADAGTHFSLEATGCKGNTQTKINLFEGSVLSGIDNKLKEDETYEVTTPNATMAVRGTVFLVKVEESLEGGFITALEVAEGSVEVSTVEDGKTITEVVDAGNSGTFTGSAPSEIATTVEEETHSSDNKEQENNIELIHVTGHIVEISNYPELATREEEIRDQGGHSSAYGFISDTTLTTPDGANVTIIGTGVPYASMDDLFDSCIDGESIDCYGFFQEIVWENDIDLYGTNYWFTIIEINGERPKEFNPEDFVY